MKQGASLIFLALLLLPGNDALLRSAGQNRAVSSNGAGFTEKVKSSLDEVKQVLMQMVKDFDTMASEDRQNWEDYSKWSDETEVAKNNFITAQKAYVLQQSAVQSANEGQIQQLTADLASLAEEISATKASIAELVKLRQEEHQAHTAELEDITKTIAAVHKATQILEGHFGAANAASLAAVTQRLQIALTMTKASSSSINQLTSLLQQRQRNPDFLNTDGSKYDNYEKQGTNVVMKLLSDLSMQLEQQKTESIDKENEQRTQYEQTKAARMLISPLRKRPSSRRP
jgi:hypothetical protein